MCGEEITALLGITCCPGDVARRDVRRSGLILHLRAPQNEKAPRSGRDFGAEGRAS